MSERFTTLTEAEFPQRVVENAAGVRAVVLSNGNLSTLSVGPTMVNLFVGSPIGGSATQVWLRRRTAASVLHARNILCNSENLVGVIERGFRWSSISSGVRYEIDFILHPERAAWAWVVRLFSDGSGGAYGEYDAVLVQDVGIASRGQVQNNEAYTSQYIDHRILDHATLGPVLAARQNLAQDGRHPALRHACIEGAAGGLTDGFDFFGPGHRAEAKPLAAYSELPTRARQYEFSCHALQSRPITLNGGSAECCFLACFEPDHPASTGPDDLTMIDSVAANTAWTQRTDLTEYFGEALDHDKWSEPLSGGTWTGRELAETLSGPHRHAEARNGRPASFFHGKHRHAVMKNKELAVDRRSAHLLMAGRERLPGGESLCSTGYAHGVFASHICLGNTTFNKLLSVSRDPLNLVGTDGLRLSIWDAGLECWQPLGVASVFDMGVDNCVWVYQLDGKPGTRLTVTATADHGSDQNDPSLHWQVEIDGPPRRLRMTAHLALGEREHEHAGEVVIDEDSAGVTLTPHAATLIRQRYPEVSWRMDFESPPADLGGDELLYEDGNRRGLPYLVAQTAETTAWGWSIRGTLGPVVDGEDVLEHRVAADPRSALPMLKHDAEPVTRIAESLPWFEHNAAIHLTAPHGIEQYGGAAWGMRDVCQGPVEWLLARGEYATAERILEDVFAHQYQDLGLNSGGGAWPQWTMHPPFQNIQSPHSHGDVAVWPIIAAVNVLRATGAMDLLERSAPYTQAEPPFALTQEAATLREHLDLAIEKLRQQFVPGTSLLAYGDGDWNDSLQPARPEMRESMVSSWTVALFYQALRGYARVLRQAGDAQAAARHDATAESIRKDFNHLLIADEQVAGLYLHADDPAAAQHLLHPRDTETGVRYRLLPMIRGIISELFTPEQAAHHAALIENHLLAPDGARLMDRPPHYTGGTMTHFQRLESASFFGREIGLMYVHAHLRYAEAMAKLGRAEAFERALLQVNPVGLDKSVVNAAARQANCYFSSSDAAFLNRADSEERYDELMAGNVPVNGGWRVYSSGPGIYLGLIVRQWLGLRGDFDQFVFDPVLPGSHNGLTAALNVLGHDCSVTFLIGDQAFNAVREVRLDGQTLENVGREANPYREGGLCFDREVLAERLRGSKGQLEVDCR